MEALCVTSNVSHQVNLIVQSLLVTTFRSNSQSFISNFSKLRSQCHYPEWVKVSLNWGNLQFMNHVVSNKTLRIACDPQDLLEYICLSLHIWIPDEILHWAHSIVSQKKMQWMFTTFDRWLEKTYWKKNGLEHIDISPYADFIRIGRQQSNPEHGCEIIILNNVKIKVEM